MFNAFTIGIAAMHNTSNMTAGFSCIEFLYDVFVFICIVYGITSWYIRGKHWVVCMAYNGVYDLRGYARTTLTGVTAVADTEILDSPIVNEIRNTPVSIYTIQVSPQADGKLILVKTDGDEEYLAGDETYDWHAKVPILVTYCMADGDSFNLKYSASTTLSDVIVIEHGGIY